MSVVQAFFLAIVALASPLARASATASYTPDCDIKQVVIEAINALIISPDASRIDEFIAPDYTQHSPFLADGRDGVVQLVTLATLNDYTAGTIVVDEDQSLVIVHARFSTSDFTGGVTEQTFVTFEMYKVNEDCLLSEHWESLQEEVTAENSVSGNSMIDPIESLLAI